MLGVEPRSPRLQFWVVHALTFAALSQSRISETYVPSALWQDRKCSIRLELSEHLLTDGRRVGPTWQTGLDLTARARGASASRGRVRRVNRARDRVASITEQHTIVGRGVLSYAHS